MADNQPFVDLDAERSLLSALLTDAPRARATMNGLTADAFHMPRHQHVYRTIVALDDAERYVDIGVVGDQLRADGLLDVVGGQPGLLEIIAGGAPPPEAAGQYAEIVERLARQRYIAHEAREAVRQAEAGDTDGALHRMAHAAEHHGRTIGTGPHPVAWADFWSRERTDSDWAWDPILPRGKATNLYAPRGTGKSELALCGSAAMATGRSSLNTPAGDPLSVVYLDLEMGEDDLLDRLTDLGYGPSDDLTHLHYYCLPELPPMNTIEGGAAVLDITRTHTADVVVVDTLARVASGEENSNDTWIGLATHTILRLKAQGVTSLWLGHAGKDATRGERGGSAKGDAVDVIWKQERGEVGTTRLTNEKRRASWVPENIDLRRIDRPGSVTYRITEDVWPVGTNEVVVELDHLDAPLNISRRAAEALLKEHGMGARHDTVLAALRWRRQRPAGGENDHG